MSTEVRASTGRIGAGVVFAVVGIVLVLLAQFTLDHLADTSDTWHNIQHGAFFVGGVCVGIGGLMLYLAGQRRV
jgi:hypothetical protein